MDLLCPGWTGKSNPVFAFKVHVEWSSLMSWVCTAASCSTRWPGRGRYTLFTRTCLMPSCFWRPTGRHYSLRVWGEEGWGRGREEASTLVVALTKNVPSLWQGKNGTWQKFQELFCYGHGQKFVKKKGKKVIFLYMDPWITIDSV